MLNQWHRHTSEPLWMWFLFTVDAYSNLLQMVYLLVIILATISVKWAFVQSLSLRPLSLSLNSNLGLYTSSADGGHDVSGPCGPAGPGTDKPTKSCKHSFSWEDMSLRYIYFFRHLRKHKSLSLTFRQTTGMFSFSLCVTCEPVLYNAEARLLTMHFT